MSNTPTSDMKALALEAFVYTYPLYEMSRMRAATSPRRVTPQGFAGDGPGTPLRWCNTFIHMRKLLGAGSSRVVTPNNDTLYSNAWMDLDESPLVIDVPDTAGRYYVLGLLDFHTNPFAHIGARLTGTGARSFLVTGPNWHGQLPAEFTAARAHVQAPTRWVWIIGRMLVDGEHEFPAVHALQDGFVMRTLADWRAAAPVAPKRFDPQCDPQAAIGAEHFAVQVNRALRDNPVPAAQAEAERRFAEVGIGANCPELPSARHAALLGQAIDDGLRQLRAGGLGGTEHEGWSMPALLDASFGTDYQRRATVALKYIGALESREAIYPMAYCDAQGQALTGHHAYRLHFRADQSPPVAGFWSLTMYDSRDFMLVPNAIDRFAIGDRTAGLKRDADGGLTLFIQSGTPSNEAARANWLPAPHNGFYLCLRAYLPRAEFFDGRYTLPGLLRCSPA